MPLGNPPVRPAGGGSPPPPRAGCGAGGTQGREDAVATNQGSMLHRLLGSWQVVKEGQAGLLYADGVFQQQLAPGRHHLAWRESLVTVVTLPQSLTVPAQEVLSADGFQPRLVAVVTFTVADPHLATVSHDGGYLNALLVEAQIALRVLAAARPAEDLARTPRDVLEAELLAAVRPHGGALGLDVSAMRLRDVILPADLRRLLTGVEKARRQGQAALERAHAEQAALRALANAARMLRNNPELQNLRLLQALGEGKSATIVLGAPSGLVPLQPGDTEPS